MAVVQPGDLLAWDWERLRHPGWESALPCSGGCSEHRFNSGPGGQGGAPPPRGPRITNLCSVLMAVGKPEPAFSMLKSVSAVGIEVVTSRRKKDQTFSCLGVSLEGQRAELETSSARVTWEVGLFTASVGVLDKT